MRSSTLSFVLTVAASAQWLNQPTDGLPRLPNSRPNPAAPAPKTVDEKPDLTERFRRLNVGRLDVQVTCADPKTYTQPITFIQPHDLWPDADVRELFCTENEKDRPHLR